MRGEEGVKSEESENDRSLVPKETHKHVRVKELAGARGGKGRDVELNETIKRTHRKKQIKEKQ